MTKLDYTHLICILDRSGSMGHIVDDTIRGFNKFIADQKAEPGDATLTLALFDDQYELVHDFTNLKDVPDLTTKTYFARGGTSLLDAVGKTFNSVGSKLSSMKEEDRPSKIVVLIMTDGHENSSREFKHAQIKSMIEHQKSKYSWQVIFIGASNIDAVAAGSSLGISSTQSYSYNASSIGTGRLYNSVSAGMSDFRRAKIGASFNMANPVDLKDEDDLATTNVVKGASLQDLLPSDGTKTGG